MGSHALFGRYGLSSFLSCSTALTFFFLFCLGYFAQSIWERIWKQLDLNEDGKLSAEELLALDLDHDGRISRQEIGQAMRKLGFLVDDEETTFIDCVLEAAGDKNKDGYLSPDEFPSSSFP